MGAMHRPYQSGTNHTAGDLPLGRISPDDVQAIDDILGPDPEIRPLQGRLATLEQQDVPHVWPVYEGWLPPARAALSVLAGVWDHRVISFPPEEEHEQLQLMDKANFFARKGRELPDLKRFQRLLAFANGIATNSRAQKAAHLAAAENSTGPLLSSTVQDHREIARNLAAAAEERSEELRWLREFDRLGEADELLEESARAEGHRFEQK
jgi:hypothetical protein